MQFVRVLWGVVAVMVMVSAVGCGPGEVSTKDPTKVEESNKKQADMSMKERGR